MIEINPDDPRPTSYSSLRAWLSCQKRWQLLRVVKVPRQPGWNLVGGSAVHLLTEWWENHYSGLAA